MRLNIIIIILLLFQGVLANFFPIFGYFDEFLLIYFSIRIIIKLVLKKELTMNKNYWIITYLLIIYLIIGIFSNVNSKVLNETSKYILGGILSMKFIIIFILSYLDFKMMKINIRVLNKLYKILNIILNIYCCIIFLNIPLKFLKSWGIRYGIIDTVSIGFSHPAELDFIAISIIVLQLFLTTLLNKNKNRFFIDIIQGFIIIVFTGRAKAMAFYIILGLSIYFIRNIKGFKFKKLLWTIPLIFLITKDRLLSEIFSTNGVRGILLSTGVKIANDFFPLGSGFGTYGSDISREIYSSIYYKYNLNNVYGLSENWPAYITDSHWASIFGEVGWIGTGIIILILILMFFTIFKEGQGGIYKLSIVALFLYAIMSSLSDTILISYRGVAIMIITNFIIRTIEVNKNYIEDNL